jgi:hypothetical protein
MLPSSEYETEALLPDSVTFLSSIIRIIQFILLFLWFTLQPLLTLRYKSKDSPHPPLPCAPV